MHPVCLLALLLAAPPPDPLAVAAEHVARELAAGLARSGEKVSKIAITSLGDPDTTDLIASRLADAHFTVVDRAKMSALLGEARLKPAQGSPDADVATSVGAQAILAGSISEAA